MNWMRRPLGSVAESRNFFTISHPTKVHRWGYIVLVQEIAGRALQMLNRPSPRCESAHCATQKPRRYIRPLPHRISFTPYSFQPEPEIPQARFVLIVKFGGLLRFLISPNQNVEPGENMLRLASD